MKTNQFCTGGERPRTKGRWALAWLLVGMFSLDTWAGGGPSGGNDQGGSRPPGWGGNQNDDNTNCSSPGDEVTSLPLVNDTHGLTFIGSLRELRALHISVRGSGRIDVQRIGRHEIAVTLMGDYRVELDRLALAISNVRVLFFGGMPFDDGVAVLQVGSSTPVMLDPERVPLPVVRIAAATRAQGQLLTLDVTARGRHAAVTASFGRGRVVLTQILD